MPMHSNRYSIKLKLKTYIKPSYWEYRVQITHVNLTVKIQTIIVKSSTVQTWIHSVLLLLHSNYMYLLLSNTDTHAHAQTFTHK